MVSLQYAEQRAPEVDTACTKARQLYECLCTAQCREGEVDALVEDVCTRIRAAGCSPAGQDELLAIIGACSDTDVTTRSASQVGGVVQIQVAVGQTLQDVHRALDSYRPEHISCATRWASWDRVVRGAHKTFSKVVEASWLAVAGPQAFAKYSEAVKLQAEHMTSCVIVLLQKTFEFRDSSVSAVTHALDVCTSWAGLLLEVGVRAVQLANTSTAEVPPELRSFGMINALWSQLLRLLTSCPDAARLEHLGKLYRSVFEAAWAQLQADLDRLLCNGGSFDRHLKLARFWLQSATKVMSSCAGICGGDAPALSNAVWHTFVIVHARALLPQCATPGRQVPERRPLSGSQPKPSQDAAAGDEELRRALSQFLVPRLSLCGLLALKSMPLPVMSAMVGGLLSPTQMTSLLLKHPLGKHLVIDAPRIAANGAAAALPTPQDMAACGCIAALSSLLQNTHGWGFELLDAMNAAGVVSGLFRNVAALAPAIKCQLHDALARPLAEDLCQHVFAANGVQTEAPALAAAARHAALRAVALAAAGPDPLSQSVVHATLRRLGRVASAPAGVVPEEPRALTALLVAVVHRAAVTALLGPRGVVAQLGRVLAAARALRAVVRDASTKPALEGLARQLLAEHPDRVLDPGRCLALAACLAVDADCALLPQPLRAGLRDEGVCAARLLQTRLAAAPSAAAGALLSRHLCVVLLLLAASVEAFSGAVHVGGGLPGGPGAPAWSDRRRDAALRDAPCPAALDVALEALGHACDSLAKPGCEASPDCESLALAAAMLLDKVVAVSPNERKLQALPDAVQRLACAPATAPARAALLTSLLYLGRHPACPASERDAWRGCLQDAAGPGLAAALQSFAWYCKATPLEDLRSLAPPGLLAGAPPASGVAAGQGRAFPQLLSHAQALEGKDASGFPALTPAAIGALVAAVPARVAGGDKGRPVGKTALDVKAAVAEMRGLHGGGGTGGCMPTGDWREGVSHSLNEVLRLLAGAAGSTPASDVDVLNRVRSLQDSARHCLQALQERR